MTNQKPKVKLVISLEKRPLFRKASVWNLKHFSLNAINRMHWRKWIKVRNDWKAAVIGECCRARFGVKTPFKMPLIVVSLYFPDKRGRDTDNYEPIKKPIMDGLVAAGVICGDLSTDYETKPVAVLYDKENPRVEIEITEI